MVFLQGASNDPTLHICGVCFGLNVAHGTNNIILINISTAHTPRPSLTSNHIHIYTNCMNTEVKFFLFSLNIWSSYFCVCSIDIPDLASMLWVFFLHVASCVFITKFTYGERKYFTNALMRLVFSTCFHNKWLPFFHFSLHIWIFSYIRNVIDLNW